MSFSDLHYGWHRQTFELREVAIWREVQLQEKGKDGVWQERSADLSGSFAESEAEARKIAEERDAVSDLRYSNLRGTLNAKAWIDDHMDQMTLGVPDNKQAIHIPFKSRVQEVDVRIVATDSPDHLKKSNIRYFEQSEHIDAGVYATFYVSTGCFDDIVRMASDPGAAFQITLDIRGWYWIGPIGDSQFYIKTEGWERAELAAIRAHRSLPNPPSEVSPEE